MARSTPKPLQGRQKVAHGASRGSPMRPLPPGPLPRRAGEGEVKGVRGALPRACALCYFLPPLPGLARLIPRIIRTGELDANICQRHPDWE
jgi:hypothetical protein